MIRPVVATFLTFTLVPFSSPAAQADVPVSQPLSIAVLQGGDATNNVRTGAVTVPIVEVRDESMKPVAGAEVTFELPASGPGGNFAGGGAVSRAKTNAAGQARAADFVPQGEGRFVIQVNARLGDRVGMTRISQLNSSNTFASGAPVDKGRSKILRVLGIAGGGAITVGLIMLSRGGGGNDSSPTSNSPTITLSPGSVTVGGPR
jgi:hypothetical protein